MVLTKILASCFIYMPALLFCVGSKSPDYLLFQHKPTWSLSTATRKFCFQTSHGYGGKNLQRSMFEGKICTFFAGHIKFPSSDKSESEENVRDLFSSMLTQRKNTE